MIFPDAQSESWKVEVCVTCSFGRRDANADIVVVNDGDVRNFDAPTSNSKCADEAIEYPDSCGYPNVQRVTFVALGEKVEDVIKDTTENCYADTDMRDQENLVNTSANWSKRKRHQQRQSTN